MPLHHQPHAMNDELGRVWPMLVRASNIRNMVSGTTLQEYQNQHAPS